MNMFLKCKIFNFKECLGASNKFLLFLKSVNLTCFQFHDISLYNKETNWLPACHSIPINTLST